MSKSTLSVIIKETWTEDGLLPRDSLEKVNFDIFRWVKNIFSDEVNCHIEKKWMELLFYVNKQR